MAEIARPARARVGADRAVAYRNCPNDGILQFTNVAWPVVSLQQRQRFIRKLNRRTQRVNAITKTLRQRRNVFATLAQWRQYYRHRVQAIEKIVAKSSRCHFLFDVAIARCDHTNVYFLRLVGTDPSNLAHLQRPQQLHLKRGICFANLVEKDGAIVCFFPQTSTVTISSGKRAFHVSEQFSLDQLCRNRATVDCHEWLIAATAASMNR